MTQPAVFRAEAASTQRRVVMFARHRFVRQLISSSYQARAFTGKGQGPRPMFFFAFLEGVEVLLRGAPSLSYVPRFAPAGRISLRTAERTRLLRDVCGGGKRHRRAVSPHGILFPTNVSDAATKPNAAPMLFMCKYGSSLSRCWPFMSKYGSSRSRC